MTKVKILKTVLGSLNGYEVKTFNTGETHDLPDTLVNAFIEQGAIELEEIESEQADEIEVPEVPKIETKVIKTRGKNK